MKQVLFLLSITITFILIRELSETLILSSHIMLSCALFATLFTLGDFIERNSREINSHFRYKKGIPLKANKRIANILVVISYFIYVAALPLSVYWGYKTWTM